MTDREIFIVDALLRKAYDESDDLASRIDYIRQERDQARKDADKFASIASTTEMLAQKLRARCNELYGELCARGKHRRAEDPEYWRIVSDAYQDTTFCSDNK